MDDTEMIQKYSTENEDGDKILERRLLRDRRLLIRREEEKPDEFSDIKLSLKEVIFIIGFMISLGAAFLNFNSKIDSANALHTLNYEVLNIKMLQAQVDAKRLEENQSQIKGNQKQIESVVTDNNVTTKEIFKKVK